MGGDHKRTRNTELVARHEHALSMRESSSWVDAHLQLRSGCMPLLPSPARPPHFHSRPAPIADGRPLVDPVNLGGGWTDFDFGALFPSTPCILANDAELQALGSWPGEGKMLYLGLGTGLGNAMVLPDQAGLPVVVPMELGHLPYRDGKTFEQCVGIAALKENGKQIWEQDVFKTIKTLKSAMVADFVVLGGGNVKRLNELPADVHRGDNLNAFLGGFRLHDPMAVMPKDIHTKVIDPWGEKEKK